MAEEGFEYNEEVEVFREHEYPMVKGNWIQVAPRSSELILKTRCYLSRPCGHRSVSEITHGEVHG
jgi:hypothetical protein